MIGIGTDILSLNRLKRVLNRFPQRIIDKILSKREKEFFESKY
jgi:phosphopantetheinyl transferase (holo-ACP synthase)